MTPQTRRLLDRCHQYQMAAAAGRRRQELVLLEQIALVQNTPARSAEQARLKAKAIRELVEGVG